ncbi:MAG: 16S rRNA (guanine(527)-N(7))-methyltransferase RsmG [Clostridia bacterium]|nr:16S rRNA (guanine(527)-N(7))-methyltransferase RsmG [Clostridia bacterium]
MEFTQFKSFFLRSCEKNGIAPLNDGQMDTFWRFANHLLQVNQTTNLTAIRNLPDVVTKHFVDSLTVSARIPQSARVLDLGCGPGFPSIPLAIARPDLTLVALDSTDKKIRFLNESAVLLGLSNLKGVAGRAEDGKIRASLGEFDVVVSRAVARLNVLCELCMPYVRLGGKLVAMKGAKGEEELAEAQNAIRILGGKAVLFSDPLLLEEGSEDRCLVEVEKISPTPKQYPRAYATILKKPL